MNVCNVHEREFPLPRPPWARWPFYVRLLGTAILNISRFKQR
jgi:hypothetical protein